ncbi:hypothetical protein [Spirosoma sp. 209]|uniref:hypothetical protein n=1 Tax=Spirosoma sp. 209 TaxID=1955701 RepID=UPI00098CF652|nr:hypothetical protein [Spirosoma sp. 209]
MQPFLHQTGFYTIRTCTGDRQQLRATIRFNRDHTIYAGHFPDRPITPGVCLYQLVKEIGMLGWQLPLRLLRAGSMKFLRLVPPTDPDIIVSLRADWTDETTVSVAATVQSGEHVAGKFQVVFSTLSYS